MPHQIKIIIEDRQFDAELNDSVTSKAVIDALPIEAKAGRWGDEIYFSIPVSAQLESDSRDILQAGELGYWPTGNAFCIFFGPTPASKVNEIKAASPVNIIGNVTGDLPALKNVKDGANVILQSA